MSHNDCPLVMIEWEDSVQPMPSWRLLSDIEPCSAVSCSSVGWLIQDDDVKTLAPNLGHINCEDVQASGLIQIPARSIVRMVVLQEPIS